MTPLNIKTNNYLLTSMIKIEELIKVAKILNLKALTIVDNNMYGAAYFYDTCITNGIKPVIGLEINLPEVILLYTKNKEGYNNLIKLTTIKSEKDITLDDLTVYSDNLICVIPYKSRNLYQKIIKIYENVFIGYENEEERKLISSNNKVYIKPILCLNKEDEPYLKYLKAIKEGKTIKEINETYENCSLIPLKKYDEEASNKLIDMCNLEIKFHQDLLPVYETKEDVYTYLKKKCIEGLKKIFGEKAPRIYIERLKYELNVINKMGFNNYFLIVSDYINYAKNNNILVGPGRGSAAGSLVAYCLNITTIDPIKYGLLFERFLNSERITMPDIDVDFEDIKREDVIKYCINKYGNKKVALIVTFGTLAAKQAIKDVCRTFEINQKTTDIFSKMLDPKLNLKQNLENPKIKQFLSINPELKKIYQIALKFEGLKRHTSIHAAGVVMSKYNLDDYIPLDKTLNDMYATEYDKDYLEKLGLLKMDFLGLKNLSLISNILSEIPDLTFDTIPEDDKDAINIFTKVDTVGIFQFESSGMINFLKKFKPACFDDIVAALALFRPGPMRNIDTYIRRRHGQEKVTYPHPDLEKILKPTYGIIIYQEQIMQIASLMAGYTLAQADLLRRAMSKKSEEILLKEKAHFIEGSIKKGYEEKVATEVYNLIFKFADYGFNKSHSVAYAMISYRLAYLKAHYPKIFMRNLLSSAINSEEKTKEYIYECKLNKVKISKPNINISENNYIIYQGNIVYPLNNIKNVGTVQTKHILEKRKEGPFKDIFDFTSRCYNGPVNQKTMESLIYAGAFDLFGLNKKTLIENLEIILNYGEIGGLLNENLKPELTIYQEYSKNELMNLELQTYGFYLSNHPVTEYKLKYKNIINLKDINDYFDKIVEIIATVDRVKEVVTKKQDKMMFITASDELEKTDIVVFPKLYENVSNISKNDVLYIKGRVEKRFDQMQVIASQIQKLN